MSSVICDGDESDFTLFRRLTLTSLQQLRRRGRKADLS